MTMKGRKRLSKKQWNRWYFQRYDTLLLEGFSPHEASWVSSLRISQPPVTGIRRRRKKMIQEFMNQGLSRQDAIKRVRDRIKGSEEEILDWDAWRRIVYKKPRSGR